MNEISQEMAQFLFDRGGILLFLHAPAGMTFGMDFNSWTIGPKFKGIKFIPPGLHFIYYSTSQDSIRSGFLHFFKEKEILVCEWDAVNECLIFQNDLDQDQVQRYKDNVRDFDGFLGTFPFSFVQSDPLNSSHTTSHTSHTTHQSDSDKSTYGKWKSLIEYIHPNVLNRILPESKFISAMQSNSKYSDVPDERVVPLQTQLDSTFRLYFTDFDLKRSFPSNGSPSLISKYSIDKSWLLRKVLETTSLKQLLGEMQLCFILLLVGQIYDGFEQWKAIVQLFTMSEELLTCVQLAIPFLKVFQLQLQECPRDFFKDLISSDNFIRHCLIFMACGSEDLKGTMNQEIANQLNLFWEFVQRQFNWDIISLIEMDDYYNEENEYAPMVVS